jgi:hypothetical protein
LVLLAIQKVEGPSRFIRFKVFELVSVFRAFRPRESPGGGGVLLARLTLRAAAGLLDSLVRCGWLATVRTSTGSPAPHRPVTARQMRSWRSR